MTRQRKGAYLCRIDEVERLRMAKGYSVDDLAKRAHIDKKTLMRVFDGKPLFLSRIARIAAALGTSPQSLIVDQQPQRPEPLEARFRVSLQVAGTLTSHTQVAKLDSLLQEVAASLQSAGITVHAKSQEALIDASGIAICYYVASDSSGRRMWYVIAAPSSMRDALCAATQRTEGADVREFGRIISSGKGAAVPKEIRELLHNTYPQSILPT